MFSLIFSQQTVKKLFEKNENALRVKERENIDRKAGSI